MISCGLAVFVLLCVCTKWASGQPNVGVAALVGSPGCDYTTSLSIQNVTFAVVIDTGSSNLAIASSQCSSCDVSPEYTGALDSSKAAITVSYGAGSWKGLEATDSLIFGGIPAVTANFVGMTSQTDFFSTECPGQEGILGLAYTSLASGGITPFFDSLVTSGVPNGFAIQLCGAGTNTRKKTGNMWLGGYDSTYISGEMIFTPIIQEEYYNVNLVSFSVNEQTISIDLPSTIIVDSGTTNIVTSQANFNAIVTALQNSGAVSFTSQAEANLFWQSNGCTDYIPASEVSLNTDTVFYVTFPGPSGQPDITLDILTLGWIRKYYYSPTLASYCLGLQVTQQDILIIGETVSYGHVVYYDRSNSKVGFATGIQCSVAPTVQGIDVFAYTNPSTPTSSSPIMQIFPTTSLFIVVTTMLILFWK